MFTEARSSKVQFVNGAGLRFSSMQVPNRQRAQACNEAECKLPNCFCTENGTREIIFNVYKMYEFQEDELRVVSAQMKHHNLLF